MPKKKAGATTSAAAHPALTSDAGPERKTPDDLVVDDPQTRALLLSLLGRWSDVQPLEEYYRRKLEDSLDFKETGLRYRYSVGDYNTGTGGTAAMTMNEIYDARQRHLESATGRLEAIIGDRIKARLIEALDDAAQMAVDAEATAIERRIAAQLKRDLLKRFALPFGVVWLKSHEFVRFS
jgi:hypothetical protein